MKIFVPPFLLGPNHAQNEAKTGGTKIVEGGTELTQRQACDLRNQERANRFTAEVERLGKSKSKVAEAAEAKREWSDVWK
jgi:hypothetical protein